VTRTTRRCLAREEHALSTNRPEWASRRMFLRTLGAVPAACAPPGLLVARRAHAEPRRRRFVIREDRFGRTGRGLPPGSAAHHLALPVDDRARVPAALRQTGDGRRHPSRTPVLPAVRRCGGGLTAPSAAPPDGRGRWPSTARCSRPRRAAGAVLPAACRGSSPFARSAAPQLICRWSIADAGLFTGEAPEGSVLDAEESPVNGVWIGRREKGAHHTRRRSHAVAMRGQQAVFAC
jgi:hypothetical protein